MGRILHLLGLWAVIFLALGVIEPDVSESPTSSATNPAEPNSLTVTVVREADAVPLPAVRIHAYRIDRARYYPLPVVESDDQGKFEFSLASGEYFFVLDLEGYARVDRRLSLESSEVLELTMQSGHQLEVEVLGAEGPLTDATVLLRSEGSSREEAPWGGKTGADGRLLVQGLPVGPWDLSIYAPGYEPYSAPVEANTLVRLRRVQGLKIRVTREGEMAPYALVHLAGTALWPARTIKTNHEGRVTLTGLDVGQYLAYGELDGQISKLVREIELAPGSDAQEVELQLEPAFQATISVVDEEGLAVPNARLTWSESGVDFFSISRETNAQGVAVLGPLWALRGFLRVASEGFMTAFVEIDPSGAQEVVLIKSGRVSGRILDQRGLPVAGAAVEVIGSTKDGLPIDVSWRSQEVEEAYFQWSQQSSVLLPAGELGVMLGPIPPLPLVQNSRAIAAQQDRAGALLTTGADGRFEISNVPPGRIIVLAQHDEYLEGKSQELLLEPGADVEVELRLARGQPLKGRVLDDREFPVENARLVVSGEGFERVVRSSSDGSFALSSAPERVSILVFLREEPLVPALRYRVAAQQRSEEIRLILPAPRAALRVRTVDANREPVSGVRVVFRSQQVEEPRRMTRFTDADGWVELKRIVGLKGELEVSRASYIPVRRSRPGSNSVSAPQELLVVLERAMELRGVAFGVRGRLPAAQARVVLSGRGKSSLTVTDDMGQFQFKDTAPGRFELEIEHAEYGQYEGSITVPKSAGAIVDLGRFQLRPPREIRGTVVDISGQTVAGALIGTDRLSAYLPLGGRSRHLAVSDAEGRFVLQMPRDGSDYLFAALPGQAVGFGEALNFEQDPDVVDEYEILLDRVDRISPEQRGTLLLTLHEEGRGIEIYALGSSASIRRALRVGDRILEIDGVMPRDIPQARSLLSGRVGSEVVLLLQRGSQKLELALEREGFRQ
ncbi:MAG: PDZ domain-containing protein [Polyangiaceae bacterium]|nr:PDZ domain-containing protein [Polyangiaceae bacterium]